MTINRRNFIFKGSILVAAPAIVTYSNMMKVKPIALFDPFYGTEDGLEDWGLCQFGGWKQFVVGDKIKIGDCDFEANNGVFEIKEITESGLVFS